MLSRSFLDRPSGLLSRKLQSEPGVLSAWLPPLRTPQFATLRLTLRIRLPRSHVRQESHGSQVIHDLYRRHPTVLRVARHPASSLAVQLLQLVDIITRDGISFGFGIDAIHPRRVQAEDLTLY